MLLDDSLSLLSSSLISMNFVHVLHLLLIVLSAAADQIRSAPIRSDGPSPSIAFHLANKVAADRPQRPAVEELGAAPELAGELPGPPND